MNTTFDEIIEKLEQLLNEMKAMQKEEDKTFRRGDVVVCKGHVTTFKAIFLGENTNETWVLVPDVGSPQQLSKPYYDIRKTGEHVDLDGILNQYCGEESED